MEMIMELKFINSEKGAKLLVLNNFKFSKAYIAKCGKIKWRCTNQKSRCNAIVFTSADEKYILESKLNHNHESEKTIARQAISNSVKRKAIDNCSERPSRLIQKELFDNIDWALDIGIDDLMCVRRNLYKARREVMPKLTKESVMASTMDQCESKPLGPLSSTLDLFNTFKPQDDDKDSDEESFHLPLLGCDDDTDNGKENSSGKNSPLVETEDDILNKFDTPATPDIDPKLEESILNGDENTTDTKETDNTVQENDKIVNVEKASSNKDLDEVVDKIEDSSEVTKIENETDIKEPTSEEKNEETPAKDEENNEAQKIIPSSSDDENKNENANPEKEDSKETNQDDKISNEKIDENTEIKKDDLAAQIEPEKNETESTKESSLPEEQNKSTVEPDSKEEQTVEDKEKIEDTKEMEVTKTDEEKTKPSDDLECEDLLDISLIRDAEEDDSNTGEKSSEKSEEDKQETDMELEQEETQTSTERDEPMEFEENTNFGDQENSTSDVITSDASGEENKENEPVKDESNSANSLLSNAETKEDFKEEAEDSSQKPELEDIKAEENEKKENEVVQKIEKTVPDSDGLQNKRPLSDNETENDEVEKKKIRLEEKVVPNDDKKTLTKFSEFMKKRNLGDGKLTRSDLEQFCLQKICEAIMHKTDVGELHQTIKRQENVIENLRKDLTQLSKQARDLEIVNKKLMSELKTQNGSNKPLVPLKITRSVGLQVKLNLGTEPTSRRKSVGSTSRTPVTPNNTPNRTRPLPQGNVVRQVAVQSPISTPSPRKPQAPAPILTQALQSRNNPPVSKSPIKRPNMVRAKDTSKPSAPGVIDLTDEDDRRSMNVMQKSSLGTSTNVMNKNLNKGPFNKVNNNMQKSVLKPNCVPAKVGMQARVPNGLPQGVRLSAAQVKNGITLPAGVVTSSAQGTTQLMYVVQPGSLVNSTAGGGQKTVLLNFQTTNGVLTSTLNGSTVSVIPSKSNSMQIKSMPQIRKHPAPLPHAPPIPINNSLKKLLPKPHLSIRKTDTGIILQWRMPYNLEEYESIASYQLYAYQETNAPPSTDMWRKVGDVKALALPMACTLTQFADKNKYYFAVRSVDVHKRIGAFSDPEEISL